MMREFKSSLSSPIIIRVLDEPDPNAGGACHEYAFIVEATGEEVGRICFQHGPIKIAGVNGPQHLDLEAIIVDRLEHFQRGPFSGRENALEMTHIQDAMHWSEHRTADRIRRQVEGRNEK